MFLFAVQNYSNVAFLIYMLTTIPSHRPSIQDNLGYVKKKINIYFCMCLNSATLSYYTQDMFNLTKRGKMENTNLEMIKGLTEGSNSLLDLLKMQKQYVDLLEKRVEILEGIVFKDVRKDQRMVPHL